MIGAIDLNGKKVHDVHPDEAKMFIGQGIGAWEIRWKKIRYLTDENKEELLKKECEFCGSDYDLVLVGSAESESEISKDDFSTSCRECRKTHNWMSRKGFDSYIESQMKMLTEFYIRYPGSSMALCRVGSGGFRDIIGYATIDVVAELVRDLVGKIVISIARNSYFFEYTAKPTSRETKPDWYKDWFYQSCGGRCFFCRRPIPKYRATLDHIVPLTRLGPNEGENLVLACEWCNDDKGTMTGVEYMEYLERKCLIGKRLGIREDPIGNACGEYQRIVSRRGIPLDNPLAPIIRGDVEFDNRCSRIEFEKKYCSRCMNERCSRMPERIEEDGEFMAASLAGDACRDEFDFRSGVDGGDGVPVEGGGDRVERNRKRRKREKKKHGHRR